MAWKVNNAANRKREENGLSSFLDFQIVEHGQGEEMVFMLQMIERTDSEDQNDWTDVDTFQYAGKAQEHVDGICGWKIPIIRPDASGDLNMVGCAWRDL